MAYTKHGHYIYGSGMGEAEPETVARCGGPKICRDCATDVVNWRNHNMFVGGTSIEESVTIIDLLSTIPDVDILINHHGAVPDILINERVSLFRVAVGDGDVKTFTTGVVTDAKREDNGSTTVVIGGKLFVIGPDVFVALHEWDDPLGD